MPLRRDHLESPACRAAIDHLLVGNARSALPASSREKLFGFLDIAVQRKEAFAAAATTATTTGAEGTTSTTNPSASPSDAVRATLDALDLPRRFDRRYNVNFTVRLGATADQNRGKGPLIRNAAEAQHEAREELTRRPNAEITNLVNDPVDLPHMGSLALLKAARGARQTQDAPWQLLSRNPVTDGKQQTCTRKSWTTSQRRSRTPSTTPTTPPTRPS